MKRSPWIVISLGGSLIVPDSIDVKYLCRLEAMLRQHRPARFAIVCGGGATSRRYIEAARRAGVNPHDEDLDRIGIEAIGLNAEFVRMIFGRDAHDRVLHSPKEFHGAVPRTKKPILICSAEKPGHSSDFNAVSWAMTLGADRIINLTNIDHVYDADPKKNRHAKPLSNISWKQYIKIVGTKWVPGLNTPFDPVAAQKAKAKKLSVAVLNGKSLPNVEKALKNKPFKGTLLHP